MRTLQLAVLILLPACAPTIDDLRMEANISGDWTAVNAKLDAEEEARFGQSECGHRFMAFCDTHKQACKCVLRDEFEHEQRELALQRALQRGH
jgi:hypothetical protein